MTFALDASVVMAWALPDEQHPVADAALNRIIVEDAIEAMLI